MSTTSLVVKRKINAPREMVFDAFTKPEMMQNWLTPKPGGKTEANNELKKGGQYKLVMPCTDGGTSVHTGEYKEVTPYSRIVFTWNSPVVQNTVVTVELADLDNGTEVTLTHDLLPNTEIRERHNNGWTGCFDNLSDYLADKSYSVKITCNAPIEKVYQAIATENGLKNWWTTTCTAEEKAGGKSTFRFGQSFNTMEIIESTPNKNILWKCIEQKHIGLKQEDEWVGTKVKFNLAKINDNQTEISFTHEGLIPTFECYDQCFMGWSHFLKTSLKNYVETGRGNPFGAENNICPSEMRK